MQPTTKFQSVLKAGDRLVYREDGTKPLKDGRVQRAVVQQHLSVPLDSGTTIQGRQIASVAPTTQDGTVTAAERSERKTYLCT